MNNRGARFVSTILAVVALLAIPAIAAAPTGHASIGASYGPAARPADPPDWRKLPELKPVSEGAAETPEAAERGKVPIYWQVDDFWCIGGGRVYLAIDGRWVASVTVPGTYLLKKKVKGNRTHSFYAVDAASSIYWRTSSYYIYSSWAYFKWEIYC